MKPLLFATLLSVLSFPAQCEILKVEIPAFTSAEGAFAFAAERISAADSGASKSVRADLLAAVSAVAEARKLEPTNRIVRARAALVCAEALLRLDSPRAAIEALGSVQPGEIPDGADAVALLERRGEASELLRPGSGRQSFDAALQKCAESCDAGWRGLLLLRAGTSKLAAGLIFGAIADLERSIRALPENSGRRLNASAYLARAYARQGDAERASAHQLKARSFMPRGDDSARHLPRTFIADLGGAELERFLDETEQEISVARASRR